MKSVDNPLEDVPLPLVPRIPEMNQPLDAVYFHEQSRINWQFGGCVEPMAASTEIWKRDICDRMTFFDDPSAPVSRYMRCIDAVSLGKDELAHEHKNGICFNNLLFNEVDWFVDSKHERSGKPDYEILGNPGKSLEAIQPGLAERGVISRTGPLYGRAYLTEQRTTSHGGTRTSLCFALFTARYSQSPGR